MIFKKPKYIKFCSTQLTDLVPNYDPYKVTQKFPSEIQR